MKKTFLDSINLPLKIIICFSVYIFFFIFTQKIYAQAIVFIENNFLDAKTLVIQDVSIKARIANEEDERIKGLSNTKKLGEYEGMFFIFDSTGLHGIWMKEMNYSIDIIWFDKDKRIIDYALNVRPSSYPTVFKPKSDALYVLEVNAGFVTKHNLKKGDKVEI